MRVWRCGQKKQSFPVQGFHWGARGDTLEKLLPLGLHSSGSGCRPGAILGQQGQQSGRA